MDEQEKRPPKLLNQLRELLRRGAIGENIDEQEKRPPKLLDQLRELLKKKHYSYKTEQSYVQWVKRYILFNNKHHPKDMGEQEITQFLSHLAVKENVSASTQNQALC